MNPPRQIRALLFELVADAYLAILVWPDDPTPTVATLKNRLKSWLTAEPGDAIVFKGEDFVIASVQLYRVNPADQNDRYVTSAAAWLDGE